MVGDKNMKICTKCKQELDESNFNKSKSSKDGYQSWCKICMKEYDERRKSNPDRIKQKQQNSKIYYESNKDKVKAYYEKNKEDIIFKHKIRYNTKRDEILKKNKEYRDKNIIRCRESSRQSYIKYKDKILKHDRERNKQLSRKISKFMHHGLTKAGVTEEHWEQYFPYTLQELKEHLELQFQPGMTWENYGRYGWHIDHIIPQSVLPFDSIEDLNFRICWSLDNLRPLWYTDNLNRPKDGRDVPEDIKQEIMSKFSNSI